MNARRAALVERKVMRLRSDPERAPGGSVSSRADIIETDVTPVFTRVWVVLMWIDHTFSGVLG